MICHVASTTCFGCPHWQKTSTWVKVQNPSNLWCLVIWTLTCHWLLPVVVSRRYTTVSYRSPEMINLYAGKAITTKADIWVRSYFLCVSVCVFVCVCVCARVCVCVHVHVAELVCPGSVWLSLWPDRFLLSFLSVSHALSFCLARHFSSGLPKAICLDQLSNIVFLS